jgi:hypothetical protein
MKKPTLPVGFFVSAIWGLNTFQALISPTFGMGIGSPEWLDRSRHRLGSCPGDDELFNPLFSQLLYRDTEHGGDLFKKFDVVYVRDLPQKQLALVLRHKASIGGLQAMS